MLSRRFFICNLHIVSFLIVHLYCYNTRQKLIRIRVGDIIALNVRMRIVSILVIVADKPRNVGGFSFTSKAPEKRLLFQFVNHPPDPH